MRTVVEINNLTKKRIKSEYVKKIVQKTAKLAGADFNMLEISVVFVSEAEIRKINQKYRKYNKSTDVLSFRYDSGYNKNRSTVGPPASLREQALACEALRAGELVVCPEIVQKNARENKINFSRELAFVLSHGVLHVLGWKHGRKMYELQDKVV